MRALRDWGRCRLQAQRLWGPALLGAKWRPRLRQRNSATHLPSQLRAMAAEAKSSALMRSAGGTTIEAQRASVSRAVKVSPKRWIRG